MTRRRVQPPFESQAEGTIGIKGGLDGSDRTVVVPLTPADYALALRAHDRKLEVSCLGYLARKGTHSTLADPIEFTAPEGFF